MNKQISDIFDYGDEIVVDWEISESCDPAEIKELTMKRIHDEDSASAKYRRAVKKTRPVWRGTLIAAIVAVLLIGTAFAVYQYTIKDTAIENVPTRDSYLYEWKAGETETRMSINGFKDSPEYEAYAEWSAWNDEWLNEHPDRYEELGVDDSYHELPDEYLVYQASFQEQGDKLDEILEKYGLTLLGDRGVFYTETQLCQSVGAEDIIDDAYDIGGYFFANGSFKAEGDIGVNGKTVDFSLWNSVKGSFIPLSGLIPEDYTEWSYTTKDGFEVLLMTDTLRETTTVIAPLSGCYVTASIRTDDAQAAQELADAIDLAVLDALFATDSARLAVEKSITDYAANLSSMTTVDEIGDDEQAVLDYLGDWYPAVLPEGVALYAMDVETPSHFEDFYYVRREYDGQSGTGSLFYRELDPLDGENGETRQQLSTYAAYYESYDEEVDTAWVNTPCTVNGYEAILSEPNGAGYGDYILCWVDTDRQLFFRLSLWGTTYDALMAAAGSITGTAPETPPARNVSTPEERFAFSLMPLGDMQMYGGEIVQQSVHAKQVLAALGNYGLTALPEGADDPTVHGQRGYKYEYYWDGRADWGEVWKTYRSDPELGFDGLTLRYKRFDGGRTAEAYEMEKRYDSTYADIAEVVVGGNDGYITGGDFYAGQTVLAWYDADRDLVFNLSISTDVFGDMTDDDMIAMAESVTEQPWTGTESGLYKLPDTERVLMELGRYDLPGAAYGSILSAADEQAESWSEAPLWFVGDGPYESESASATYADGLALGWQRTWADTARTAENSGDSFAAMTKYLLACDDSGAVQTGLSVNGNDAICVFYPCTEFFEETCTQLIWYDADAGLIFTLSDLPGEDGTPRTAAQLVTLAESVTAQ